MASWHSVAVLVNRPLVGAASRALLSLGAIGLEEDVPPGLTPRYRQPWDKGPTPRAPRRVLLRAWFTARPDDDAVTGALAGKVAGAPEWTVVQEQDWSESWKEHFNPIRISERLTIAAPWHGVEGALLIEPGNAFGTGEHITTRRCLHAVDQYAVPGGTLLDVGCGSGILALAAARLGMHAWGVDTDPVAVEASRAAALLNGLEARFDTTSIAEVPGTFDLVVANLFAEVLAELAPHLLRVAAGPIATAGVLVERSAIVREAFRRRPILEEHEESGWISFVFGGP